MIHVKMLIVDDLWSAIGTTNLDNRSFEHNDEVNLTVRDETIAARLTADNEADMSRSHEVTLDAVAQAAAAWKNWSAPSRGCSNASSSVAFALQRLTSI